MLASNSNPVSTVLDVMSYCSAATPHERQPGGRRIEKFLGLNTYRWKHAHDQASEAERLAPGGWRRGRYRSVRGRPSSNGTSMSEAFTSSLIKRHVSSGCGVFWETSCYSFCINQIIPKEMVQPNSNSNLFLKVVFVPTVFATNDLILKPPVFIRRHVVSYCDDWPGPHLFMTHTCVLPRDVA